MLCITVRMASGRTRLTGPLTLWIDGSYNPLTLRDEIERHWRRCARRRTARRLIVRSVARDHQNKEVPVSKELSIRALFDDALAGRVDRRTVLRRAAALGVSAPVAAALAQETMRAAWRLRRASRTAPSITGCPGIIP